MQQEKSFGKKLEDRVKIQQTIDELRDEIDAQRVLIFSCNNGLGIHSFGFQLKINALYQSYEPPFKSVMQDLQDLTVDGHYAMLLRDVYDNSMTAFYSDQMPVGVTRTIYDSNVRWAAIYKIGEDKINKRFFYMSISTAKEKTPYQLGQEKYIVIGLNKIRNIHEYLNRTTIKRIREKLYF